VTPHNSELGARNLQTPVGVLLMSFGTAATLDDVPAYLASVRGGKPAPDELVAEFQRRFARVGGSPLTRITRDQAAALEALLNEDRGSPAGSGAGGQGSARSAAPGPWPLAPGPCYVVRVGMRHAAPFIADGLRELADAGARRLVGIILSPQYSDVIMGGYLRAAAAARDVLGGELDVTVVGAWNDVDEFLDGLAARLSAALDQVPGEERENVPVLCTAHSLPRNVADGEPGYIEQLRQTAAAVAERAGLAASQWNFAYQSAGHTREEWLIPDIKDLLPGLRADGHKNVVVAPIQFLSDHLEVLYDIDIAAREEAEALGMELIRTEMLNCDPALIHALAAVVRRELAGSPRPLGEAGEAP
jgi:protoporphyrin/coproporphyrin ferrochelatase